MELTAFQMCIVNVFLVFISHSSCRTTEKEKGPEDDIEIKLLVKREAPLNSQELPYVDGRTFRASQPINPNPHSETEQNDLPQSLIGEAFETRQTVFQPEVENNDVTNAESLPAVTEGGEEGGEDESRDTGTGSTTGTRRYAAQYSYGQTTSEGQAPSGGQTGSYASSGAGSHPSASETLTNRRHVQTYDSTTSDTSYGNTAAQRRVAVYGGGGSGSYNPGYQTESQTRLVAYGSGGSAGQGSDYQRQRHRVGYGTNTQGSSYQTHSRGRVVAYGGSGTDGTGSYQPVGTGSTGSYQPVGTGSTGSYQPVGTGSTGSYQPVGSGTGTPMTGNGYYYNSRSGGSPYRYGQTQGYVGNRLPGTTTSQQYGGSGSGIRYENGRYYDSAGHEVDPYGRHRDSSGRLIGSSTSDDYTQGGFPSTYDPVISQISNDPNCPTTNIRVRINGLLCRDAVSQLGEFVCYNYERVSRECCERCLAIKNPSQVGCEYGDRSYQCRNIQPFDCYAERNRQICCEKCREYREQMQATAAPYCEYGDLTPRCLTVRQRSHLCYLQENQRLCCATCPRLANEEDPYCRWGNQSPELCEPFDQDGQLRLNCYIAAVQEVCCLTCRRLRRRMRDEIPGCEYGDSPVQFSTGTEILDCAEYIGRFGMQICDDSEIASKCCYTCYRYRSAGRG